MRNLYHGTYRVRLLVHFLKGGFPYYDWVLGLPTRLAHTFFIYPILIYYCGNYSDPSL